MLVKHPRWQKTIDSDKKANKSRIHRPNLSSWDISRKKGFSLLNCEVRAKQRLGAPAADLAAV